MEAKLKLKRSRNTPNRRWTKEEEEALLNFLLENREFEKPTAQIYYRRFIAEKGVEVQWKLLRSKVRNMRIAYGKAKAFENSTGARNLNDGETMKDILHKMCSFYVEFDDIFGSQNLDSAVVIESLDEASISWTEMESFPQDENISDSFVISEVSPIENSRNPECPASTSRKDIYGKASVSDIMEIHTEMLKLRKIKMDQDNAIKEKEIALQEEKFQFEKVKHFREFSLKERELELKEKELQNQKEFNMLQIQMRERIALKELEMRERMASKFRTQRLNSAIPFDPFKDPTKTLKQEPDSF